MTPPTPQISFVIPVISDDGAEPHPLGVLLDSITATVTRPHEVIAVLNTPQDTVLRRLVETHPAVTRYAINSQNAGIARSWNIGAHLALGKFCCFVNQDVILGEGCIEGLCRVFDEHRHIGVAGVMAAEWRKESNGVITHKRFVRAKQPATCNAVSGFLFMTPTQVLRAVGFFGDEYAPLSYEEVDFSFRVLQAGYSCMVAPHLNYEHEWGISAAAPGREITWLGHTESIREINARNRKRLATTWGARNITHNSGTDHDGGYYGEAYFAAHDYVETMTQERMLNGKRWPPLVGTLADMVLSHVQAASFSRILDLGCAYGFLVAELCDRGKEAFGIDFSQECISASPVPRRVRCLNALDVPLGEQYDLVVMTDIVEHLSDLDLEILLPRLRKITRMVYMNINNSGHEPSHINIRSMAAWQRFLKRHGYHVDRSNTKRARRIYRQQQAGTELWHKFTFFFNLD